MRDDNKPRNFFAEWNRREQKQHEESVSLLAMLKDVSGLTGLKVIQSKTPPQRRS